MSIDSNSNSSIHYPKRANDRRNNVVRSVNTYNAESRADTYVLYQARFIAG